MHVLCIATLAPHQLQEGLLGANSLPTVQKVLATQTLGAGGLLLGSAVDKTASSAHHITLTKPNLQTVRV